MKLPIIYCVLPRLLLLYLFSRTICASSRICAAMNCTIVSGFLLQYISPVLDGINILLCTLFSKVWSRLSSFAPIKSNTWSCVLCLVSISTFPDMKYYDHRMGNLEMLQMQVKKFSKLWNYIRLNNNNKYLFTAIRLLPGGSSYFTCKQNMKLVTTKFKSEELHEKHVVATWNVGNHLSICL